MQMKCSLQKLSKQTKEITEANWDKEFIPSRSGKFKEGLSLNGSYTTQ